MEGDAPTAGALRYQQDLSDLDGLVAALSAAGASAVLALALPATPPPRGQRMEGTMFAPFCAQLLACLDWLGVAKPILVCPNVELTAPEP